VKDFQLFWGDFNTTQITINAVSEAGRNWMAANIGACAVGMTIRKSGGQAFLDKIADAGLTAEDSHTEAAA